jgi:hypothetical protein
LTLVWSKTWAALLLFGLTGKLLYLSRQQSHLPHMQHYDEGFEQVTLQKFHACSSIHADHRVVYLHIKGAYHKRPTNEQWRRHMTAMVTSRECLAPPNNTWKSIWMGSLSVWASFMPGNIWTARCVPRNLSKNNGISSRKSSLSYEGSENFPFECVPERDVDSMGID